MRKMVFAAALALSCPFFAAAQSGYLVGTASASIEPDTSLVSLILAGYGAPMHGRFSITWEAAGDRGHWASLFGGKESAAGFPAAPGEVSAEVISRASDGKRQYVLCSDNTLWRSGRGEEAPWIKIGCYNGVTWTIEARRIAFHQGRLYALAANDSVYRAGHSSDGNLSVGALAVKKGKNTAVIVSADVCGIDYTLTEAVRESLLKKRGLAPEALMINSSHTHFAPVAQKYPGFGHGHLPDSLYLNNVVKDAIIACVESALDNMRPSGLYFGRGSTNIGYNRRAVSEQKPHDQTLDVLKVEGRKGQESSILFLTGCHPVFRNEGKEGYTISANYPGVARELLEQKTGAGNTLFLQGCAGDINPRAADHRATGRELASDVLAVLGRRMDKVRGGIRTRIDSVLFPIEPWPEEKVRQFRKENETKKGDIVAERNVRWADLMLRHYRNGDMPEYLPVYIQTIDIGDWKLVGLSREVVTEYGPALRAIWPGKTVSVAGYCNDVASYLPHDWHIEEGVYEGKDSFFWYGQAGIFPTNAMETIVGHIKASGN